MLTPAQKSAYARDGYLVLPGFKPLPQLAALRARALQIVDAFDANAHRTVFTTREQARQVDDYFLASAQAMHCFFEEEAFDAAGQLRQAKHLSINKIGHALHDLDPVFDRFSRGPALAQLAADLGLLQPQLWQSLYIFKQPGIGGEVRWHQDATFFETTPQSVTTFWFALEDATVDNGCLWVQPGGHAGAGGLLRERFVRSLPGQAPGASAAGLAPPQAELHMEPCSATPWPDSTTAIPLEVSAGTLVVFDGLLPHYSAPNRSAQSRHAYTLHATDGRATYSPRNWLQRDSRLPVRGFGVA